MEENEAQTVKETNDNEFAQMFHDRAWQLSNDLSKLLLSLSTAILAGIFIALTDDKIELIRIEKILLLVAISCFGLSICSAIFALHWDAQRNYHLGQMNRRNLKSYYNDYKKEKNRAKKGARTAKIATRWCFILGIIFSGVVLFLFVLN